MYLSAIKLDNKNCSVIQAYRNCQDMHRNLMKCFNSSRKDANLLYRLGPNNSVYMLSNNEPQVNGNGMTLIKSREFDPDNLFTNGNTYRFQILASPCKAHRFEGRNNNSRIYITDSLEREDWFRRQGERCGFEIISCQQTENPSIKGWKSESGKLSFRAVNFSGVLVITNKEKFINAYSKGIGTGKSYGLGMLMIM